MQQLKIGPRLVLFLAAILLVSWSGMLVWTYQAFKNNAVDQARDFAENVHTMTLAGLTGMMITGTVGQRAVFLDQIRSTREIPELTVLRGDAVSKQFGPGESPGRKLDGVETRVMETGEPFVEEEDGKILRAVYPAKASRNFLGKDCLMCHLVPEGTVLGLVSMRISLEKAESAVDAFTFKAVGTAALLVCLTLGFTVVFVRKTVSEPLANACNLLHEIADGEINQKIVIDRQDETGDLLHSMQTMQQSLKRLVKDVHGMVEAAARGNFSNRIDPNSQKGFGRDLCGELNHLSEVTQSSLAEIVSVAEALAQGDLGRKVIKSYPGVFGEASRSINATVDALNDVIAEVRAVVDEAANGQFETSLEIQGKRGYVLTLSNLLNRLTETTRRALTDILKVADEMSEGNLTVQMDHQHPGMFGETGEALNKTAQQLQGLIGQVVSLVDLVQEAANRLADGNHELMHQMREQETGLSSATQQMNGVVDKLRENAAGTNKASEMAKASSLMAEQGSEVVRQTVSTMNDISESSHQIREIIGVIDSIAFQTNILALNAAVEAARAGEQGRGFAVVAAEVRSLAQRSAQAAQEIKALITESVNKVEAGTERVNLAGNAMGRIEDSIYQMNRLMLDVSRMSTQQSEGIVEVVGAVDRINHMNQQNCQLINVAGDAVVSLVEQAESLRRLMDSFRIS